MEGALEPDHRVTAGEGARELDRVLHRLGAGVEESRLDRPADRQPCEEALSEGRVILVRHDSEVGVAEMLQLLLRRLDDMRMRMADVQAADPACEIDERVPVEVGDRGATRVGGDDGEGDRERRGDARRQAVQHLARAGARNFGLQDDRAGGGHGPRVAEETRPCMAE